MLNTINTINRIIEIDSIAQKRLNDAYTVKDDVKKELLEKNEQMKKAIDEKTNSRIEHINEIEEKMAREKIEEIDDLKNNKIKKLEQTYLSTHQKLEQDIFLRVIE